jgi:hypothetical protein
MELTQLIDRAVEIRDALPLPNVKQRLAAAAQELSLAGYNQSRVEILQESVLHFTTTLYAVDQSGRLENVDHRTHRILIAAPWGSSGWNRWNMRRWESTILRKTLIVRCEMRRIKPLFDFGGGQWFLNLADYGRLDLALLYWKANPITLKDWHLHADLMRQQARDRMDRLRGKE